ncbi:LON peptidase substrate-binding domain-containing protein [Nguyenibacter sp. L1]|uniref:LON peptidase substrate-binding domain-containing protein n=1 Tax=Nguyenibacter sp. L1 TaxID=3049350 RepID=UPI002B46B2BD|nr:LON peptidase substrate-binding domain-containing protein [Nguyenibacter sp. L1]WRH89973.1 LON peptidase substrate-binding domain-containing protein [Nguyenibacter sp. L1]
MTLADIPPELGLFPLREALLLPRGKLPLNVFEPRYVALVEDALAGARLIGMIQPRGDALDEDAEDGDTADGDAAAGDEFGFAGPAALYDIGCIGRITSMTERADGTYAVTLTGLSRFRLLREARPRRGYRLGRIDASSFAGDLTEGEGLFFDRPRMIAALRRYCRRRGFGARWTVIEQMDDEALLITLPMICPFATAEKQALLESGTLNDRARTLQALLDLGGHGADDEGRPS